MSVMHLFTTDEARLVAEELWAGAHSAAALRQPERAQTLRDLSWALQRKTLKREPLVYRSKKENVA